MLVDLVSDSDSDVTTFDIDSDNEEIPLEFIRDKLAKQRTLASQSVFASSGCPAAVEKVQNDGPSPDVSLNSDHDRVQIISDKGVTVNEDQGSSQADDEESSVASTSVEETDECDVSVLVNLSRLSRLSKRDTLKTFQEDDELSPSVQYVEDIRTEADDLSQVMTWKDCMTPKTFLRKLGHCPISPFAPVISQIDTTGNINATTPETKHGFDSQKRQRYSSPPPESTRTPVRRSTSRTLTPQRSTPRKPTPRKLSPRKPTPQKLTPPGSPPQIILRKSTPLQLRALKLTPDRPTTQKSAPPIQRRSWPARSTRQKSAELTGSTFPAPSSVSQKVKSRECPTPMIPKSTYDNLMTNYYKLEKKIKKVKKKRKLEHKQLTLQNFEGRNGNGPITRDQVIATLSETVCTIFKNRSSFPQIGFTEAERQLRNPMDEFEKEAIRNEIRSRKRDCDCLCFCKDDLADEVIDDRNGRPMILPMPPLTSQSLDLFSKTV